MNNVERYLITGSTGFVGRRLLGLLNTSKCKIKLLARQLDPNYETIVCNLGKDKIPLSALESVDTVFHLAGFTHDVRGSSDVKWLYQSVNVDATVELAELSSQSGVKNFVFVSSVKAGGGSIPAKCMSEVDQGEPEGIYGKTKREAELRLLEIGRKSSMHVSIIRPSLVYGPNVKGNLKSMLLGIEKGWFPPLPEIGNKRSMIHVDDLVRAIMLVANDYRANGEIFIATDGKYYSSRQIYEAMCSVLGRSSPRWSVPRFLFDVIASVSPRIKYKVNKLLGDECYSSEKLESIGFSAQRTLQEMNETSF
jgi:nucleoside-diphosphate-sugar epimerase